MVAVSLSSSLLRRSTAVAALLCWLSVVNGFSRLNNHLLGRRDCVSFRQKISWPFFTSLGDATAAQVVVLECATVDDDSLRVSELKRRILELGASYDRGFGASPSARDRASQVIQDLERNNRETNAARSMDGTSTTSDDVEGDSPLRGSWRMVWTSAFDVLSLEASPLSTTAAIYQIIEPPVVTNVIDLLPRFQAAFPLGFPNTLVRLKVQTRGSERPGQPNRVGLVFEQVRIQPLQLFGMSLDVFPPLGFDLPSLPTSWTGTSADSPGYFDVTYLDDDFLIIRQNAPGGVFVSIRVDNIDP